MPELFKFNTRLVRCRAVAILIVGLIAGLRVPPVLAHGIVERADPPAGGSVADSPRQVQVWFTEPIEPRFSRLEVYAAGSNSRVDLGDMRFEGDRSLVVSLPPDLPQGAVYVVVWQIVTLSDAHATRGEYSFGVGAPAAVMGTIETDRSPLADLFRFASLAGQMVFVGLAVFRWAVRLEDDTRFRRSLFWVMQATRAALALGVLGSLYTQASSLDASIVEVLATQWGAVWLARAAMTALIAIRIEPFMRGDEKTSAMLAGGFLTLTASLTSHSAAQYGAMGVAMDWVHLLSAAVWSGGVVCAALALAAGERKFLSSFSILATAAVGGLAASGLWLSNGQVGSWAGLFFTEYGRILTIKLAVVAVAFALGAFNALGAAKAATTNLEAIAGLIVILLAAVLTNTPPAWSQTTDNAPTRIAQNGTTGDLSATLTLSPARIGTNTVEVTLNHGGLPVTGAEAVVQFQPLGPGAVVSQLPLREVSAGVYSATGANLTAEGEWQALLTVNAAQFLAFGYSVGPDRAVRVPHIGGLDLMVQLVAWLNRYALTLAAGLLLMAAGAWSGVAWRSLPRTGPSVALWLAPGLLLAGAVWLWIRLNF